MLKEHLIVKTRPQANEGNVVRWRDYRITVLGDRLFRLEQSERGIFRDSATQAVWYRDMPKQAFAFTSDEKAAVIDTGACKLILRGDRGQVRVELNGKVVRADNSGNLLGTYRTLDCCDGDMYYRHWIPDEKSYKIELGKGFAPRRAWRFLTIRSRSPLARTAR